MTDVTIVMAARNEERYVERALRSCNAQTIPTNLILIDDCSDDRTAELAAGGGAHLIQNTEHVGLPASLNRGIRAANTRYVVRVDADDYVAPEFAEILAMHLDYNPSFEAVACDYYTVDEQERHLEHLAADSNPIGCGIMFRKDRLVEIGLYDEAFLLWEDRELRERFRWPVHRVALPLYRYRRHPGSMTIRQQVLDLDVSRFSPDGPFTRGYLNRPRKPLQPARGIIASDDDWVVGHAV